MKRLVLVLVLGCVLPVQTAAAPQDVERVEFVFAEKVRLNAMECYTTGTGILIQTVDACPDQAKVEKEIKYLFKRLGAPKDFLKGHVVTYTRDPTLTKMPPGWLWVDGVTTWSRAELFGKLVHWEAWSVVSTSTYSKKPMDTLIHELGHAAFEKIGEDSLFLDTEKASVEKSAVLDRTKLLPKDHPARAKFKALH